ncbi:DUF6221 family protein [Streptomyces sp. NPDC059783]|uniref:DUF6221 family protein n=1 Tax=Streptomyces sp. NPDC059783 TaxID=3346944 RepID=UPI003647320B
MDDLIVFLRARLDDDAAAARAASWDGWDGSHWTAHHRERHDGRWAVIDRADEGVIPTVAPQAADDAGVAQHIACHDPARVLREVEAKGRILDSYLPDATGADEQINEEWQAGSTLADDLLCLLALPYADHPDYRDDWRP